MPFLLPTYYRRSHRERVAPAAVVIPPPESLRQELAKQGQDIVDTVADGNCGLDAFGHGLASVASRNRRLYNTAAYKAFNKTKNESHDPHVIDESQIFLCLSPFLHPWSV